VVSKQIPRAIRTASGRQLWWLNQRGWLQVRDVADLQATLTSQLAHEAIQRALALEKEDERGRQR
jgi:hypothetical protein